MTDTLKEYYNNKFGIKPTFLINTIVDTDRFVQYYNGEGLKQGTVKLCYMGNMELAKDNVDNIITSITILREKYNDIQFDLYGTPNEIDKKIIINLIKQHNLEDNVFFKGRINNDSVPETLIKYDILVSSQPETFRAQGGFPTKLGEYLMSGVPTLLTDVGEISQYIADGENAFMVESCSPEKYAAKIDYIINHYTEALQVAVTGRNYILNNFSCEKATLGFAEFIRSI